MGPIAEHITGSTRLALASQIVTLAPMVPPG